jgi:hypothetical protein
MAELHGLVIHSHSNLLLKMSLTPFQNIVTSWADSAARAMGLQALPEHDERYEIAEEYMQLLYK